MMFTASEAYELYINGLINVSTYALYIFDSLCTFPQEVDLIWTYKWSTTSWIYLALRYLTLLYVIIPNSTGPKYAYRDHCSCKALSATSYILQDLQFVPFALFSAIRVYALLGGRVFLAAVICALSLVPFATNIYHFANVTTSWVAGTRICNHLSDISFNIVLRYLP
ncbi:hypothetical protein BC629DRAFT_1103326 [Irpex lacteus]|nr:hypothetical protein BC629DRAFT_1103326 [Irpex lacteus]